MAAELGQNFAGRKGVDHGRSGDEDSPIAVEIGALWIPIVLVALADPMRSCCMLLKDEGAGAEDVLSREIRIFRKPLGTVDAVPGGGEVRQHHSVRTRQLEDDGMIVRRFDRLDVRVGRLADGDHTVGRIAQAIIGRTHIFRGEG